MTAAPDVHPLRRMLIDAGVLSPENDRPQPTVDLSGLPVADSGDKRAARYADAALRSETFVMSRTGEGGRNDQLNRSAYKLGSLVSAGHLDRDRMVSELWQAARVSGLDDREIGRTLRSGGNAGAATPRVVKLADPPAPAAVELNGHPRVAGQQETPGQTPSTVDGDPHAGGEVPEPSTPDATPPFLNWHNVFRDAPLEPEWIVPEVFEAGGLYALYSPAKAGKSLWMLDIAASLAAGRSVLGFPPGPPVPSLYTDAENGHQDLVRRLTAMGYGPDDLDHLAYWSFPRMSPLDTPAGGAQMFAAVQAARARVLYLDTIGRMIAGPENDADTWHALYRCTLAPLKGAGVTVIRLDHLGKDQERGMRGSSAKVSDVDAAYRLSRIADGVIQLERTHTRNGNGPERLTYRQATDPLRHLPSELSGMDIGTQDVMRHLDLLGVPAEWGREKVREFLATRGVRCSTDALRAAINARRHGVEPADDPRSDLT